jgi:hypothetical protein
MENEDRNLFRSIKRASILSGIGMGLLLGIIMGLSVSEVVKIIMGTITALLGAFLGFDKRSFSGMTSDEYQKEKENTLFTALRAGWFGFTVVAGLFMGMFIRTHEMFSPTLEKSVKKWTDAGYAKDYALKLVAFQRLGINPVTGQAEALTAVQKQSASSLFSSQQARDLCGESDPDQWNGDWKTAKEGILELEDKALLPVVAAIEENIPEKDRFAFLKGLQNVICYLGGDHPGLCGMGTNINAWAKNDATSVVAAEIAKLPANKQKKMMGVMSELICQLEKE